MTLNDRFTVRRYRLFGRGVHGDQTVHFSTDLTVRIKINIIRIARYLCGS